MFPRVVSASAYREGYEFGPTEHRVHGVCAFSHASCQAQKTLPPKNEIGVLAAYCYGKITR